MKLTWHIIWKDIRAERGSLLFWAALFIAQVGLGLAVFHADGVDRSWIDGIRAGNLILVGMQAVTGYVLVARLVQSDAITGTRTFWRTRPIGSERLLRAKVGVVLLLCGLLPVLLKMPWWLFCGFAPSDLGWATLETLGWLLLLVGPAFLIAALTDDLGRAVMWGLVLLAGLIGGVLFLQDKLSDGARPFLGFLVDDFTRPGGLMFTRVWLCALGLTLGSIAIARHQFLTRRFHRSIASAMLVAGIILATGRWWPVDCTILLTQINEPEELPFVDEGRFSGVQLAPGTAQIQGSVQTADAPGRPHSTWIWVEQTVELRGVPDGLVLQGITVQQTWRWTGDRQPVARRMFFLGDWSDRYLRRTLALPPSQGDAETARWLEGRYAERLADGLRAPWPDITRWLPQSEEEGDRLVGRMLLPASLVARIRGRAPAAEARVEAQIARVNLLFEQPLKPGMVWSGQSRAFRVGPWEKNHQEDVASVQFLSVRPGVRENGLWSADIMERPQVRRIADEFNLIPVNRHNNTLGSTHRSSSTNKSGLVVIGGVVLRWNTVNIHSSRVVRNGEWVGSDPDWREHTTLALIVPAQVGRFRRELRTDKYELAPPELEKAKAEAGPGRPPGKI